MSESEIVMRIAKVLRAARECSDTKFPCYFCYSSKEKKVNDEDELGCVLLAHDVIEALREPTPEMIEAGRWPAEDDGPKACWQAMIAAAKKVNANAATLVRSRTRARFRQR